jgi:hypothetical protein
MSALTGIDIPIVSATAITGTATTAIVGDTVTATATAHGFPLASDAVALIDGIERKINVLTADTFSYLTDTAPPASINYSAIHIATSAHTVPFADAPILGVGISGINPSFINGVKLGAIVSATDIWIAENAPTGAISAISAFVHIAQATITGHGLPTLTTLPVRISGVSAQEYNGIKSVFATGANTIYFGRAISTITPNYSIATLSVIIGTTATAHGYVEPRLMKAMGNAPAEYNGTFSTSFHVTNGFSFIADVQPFIQPTAKGKLLSSGAFELNLMLEQFFLKARVGVNILEIGTTDAINTLSSYVANNPKRNHVYAMPRGYDTPAMLSLLQAHNQTQGELFLLPVVHANFNDFQGLYSAAIIMEHDSVHDINHAVAEIAAEYVSTIPTAANRMRQMLYRSSNQQPFPFTSFRDPLLFEVNAKNVTFISDTAEAAISGNMINGACLTAPDGLNGKIDIMSKWAENYLLWMLDSGLARRIFRSSNEAGMELNLNDAEGQVCIDVLRTTAQGIVDAAAAAGVCEPTTVLAQNYWDWKAQNPLDFAEKRYTGLSIAANLRIGLREVVFNFVVSFNK